MGIKTVIAVGSIKIPPNSEKPPHHMGIKTPSSGLNAICTQSSEKPPHHSGIIQR